MQEHPKTTRLVFLPPGSRARVVGIDSGYGLRTRLLQMGLTPGAIVEIVDNTRGPVIIRVRGVVIALGRGMASRIIVEPL